MAKDKILIVEDDKNISKLLKYNLEKDNYEAKIAKTGELALKYLDEDNFDLILLDIMLPKMDGFEVCRNIKQDKKLAGIPIVMLTAKGQEVDKVVGFELGVDDYVVKPFSPRELLLRIKARIRKKEEIACEDVTTFKNLKIDIPRHKIEVSKKEIKLTPMEFKLLITLIERKGRVQSRDRLLDDVWGISSEVTTRTVDTHIKSLRKKLLSSGDYIETIRGLGYRFKEKA
jgi:DNA-binding response OmpR family regulator